MTFHDCVQAVRLSGVAYVSLGAVLFVLTWWAQRRRRYGQDHSLLFALAFAFVACNLQSVAAPALDRTCRSLPDEQGSP